MKTYLPFPKKKTNLCVMGWFLASLFLLSTTYTQAQFVWEGTLPIKNYTSKVNKGKPQNWAVTQDKRGVMYFANNGGVLEYDGTKWNLIELPKLPSIRSLAVDSTGRIFVGAQDEFGYLFPNKSGKMVYKSLLNHVDTTERKFLDVWKTHATSDGVYFQAKEYVFYWDGKSITSFKPSMEISENALFHVSFAVNNTFYVKQKEVGLTKIEDGKLQLVKGGAQFANDRIYAMIPFMDDKTLIITRSSGTFVMDANENIQKYSMGLDNLLSDMGVYSAIRINESLYAIATLRGGVVVFNEKGGIVTTLSKENGLMDNSVKALFLDQQGNMWLALGNGLSKVDINSPITHFNENSNLEGTVEAVERYMDRIYIATTFGVYYYLEDENKFMPLEGMDRECFSLYNYKSPDEEILLIASGAKIYQVDSNHVASEITNCLPWCFYQSNLHPSLVYIGLNDGLMSMVRINGRWEIRPKIDGITEQVHNIEEDSEGNLWMGTLNDGILKLDNISTGFDTVITKYGPEQGVPEEFVYVVKKEEKLLFGTDAGIFRFNSTADKFELDPDLNNGFLKNYQHLHRLSIDLNKNIWAVAEADDKKGFAMGYLDDSNKWYNIPFLELSADGIIHTMHHDDSHVTWLGGPEGLYRYDAIVKKNYNQDYNTLIREVLLGKDSTLFGGTYFNKSKRATLKQPKSLNPTLPYSKNSIHFEFSSTNFFNEGATKYSWYLEGYEEGWSEWNRKMEANYTNLPEGTYKFHVKSTNIYGHEGKEAVYSFTILPPWYRTIWAYIGYIIGFISFVYGAVVFSTRRLKTIIKNATAEIVKQRDEIVQQKDLIEEKNRDITDSIEYASRIQQAILSSEEYLEKILPEHFILFKPRDIVSGDFYWAYQTSAGKAILAVADCTGHGVPGAFMSMIGNSLLNEIVIENGIDDPAEILNRLKDGIIKALDQKNNDSKDGMDISIAVLDKETKKLYYAGANNPLYIVSPKQTIETNFTIIDPNISLEEDQLNLFEIKPDKMPIGYMSEREETFTTHTLTLESTDIVYLFSDGYADQFGGPKGKKFKYKTFKQLLLSLYTQDLKQQAETLDNSIEEWRGEIEQVDDICVAGIKA
jgi:serine phosphatase RsbU (regulator of sigma subunit)/ligand-binding sensor domain-containing protein